MASQNFELVSKLDTKPEVLTLADGGTVEVHTFEAQIKGFNAGHHFETGPSAAALWVAHEKRREHAAKRI